MTILKKIMDEIAMIKDLSTLSISRIYLGKQFNVIQLSDNSVGAAMNYYSFRDKQEILNYYKMLDYMKRQDPLLIKTLFEESSTIDTLLKLSLQNTLVNALSREIILTSGEFQLVDLKHILDESKKMYSQTDKNREWVTIIGFGGFLDFFLLSPEFPNIYVSDLSYHKRKEKFDELLKKKNIHNKNVIISDASDQEYMINKSKMAFLTGSALSNGTMEGLLDMSKDCPFVVVQGESCSVYPRLLFEEYGVDAVITTFKPDSTFFYIDYANEFFRNQLFEGYLQPICIMKK